MRLVREQRRGARTAGPFGIPTEVRAHAHRFLPHLRRNEMRRHAEAGGGHLHNAHSVAQSELRLRGLLGPGVEGFNHGERRALAQGQRLRQGVAVDPGAELLGYLDLERRGVDDVEGVIFVEED